ncbi:MAG: PIN domain-containing protein [Actinobacteria bacterium]|nr:PIN domain-containing protein [Actinomycetota bacterium]
MRVLLDTTVLCGALVQPNSINFKLLMLAKGPFFDPIISEVVVYEFINKCRAGIKGRQFSEEDLDDFWAVIAPLLEPENIERISIGRRYAGDVKFFGKPIEQVIHEITQRRSSDLLDIARASGLKYQDIDPYDLHLLVAAIEHDCDCICTSNTKDLPSTIGRAIVVKPGKLYRRLTE